MCSCFFLVSTEFKSQSFVNGRNFLKPESLDEPMVWRLPVLCFLQSYSERFTLYVHIRAFSGFYKFLYRVIYPFGLSLFFQYSYLAPKIFLLLLLPIVGLSTCILYLFVGIIFIILEFPFFLCIA